MRARTYDGDIPACEYIPTYHKCENCKILFHEDWIEQHPGSGMYFCLECMPIVLEEEKKEEAYNPESI